MRFARQLILSVLLIFSLAAWSQNVKIIIPAGSPEDKELSAIAAEGDAQKRIASYEEFIKKYADNKPALAYGEWQLSIQYSSAGDTAKALEYGDKALELYPNNLDIIVSQAGVAQAMKDNSKVVDYAVRGAASFSFHRDSAETSRRVGCRLGQPGERRAEVRPRPATNFWKPRPTMPLPASRTPRSA